jgi:hypothetical protein
MYVHLYLFHSIYCRSTFISSLYHVLFLLAYGSEDTEGNNFVGVEVSLVEQPQSIPPSSSHVW